MELNLAAARSELDAAVRALASRDETSAESKSQAEAAAARLQVRASLLFRVTQTHDHDSLHTRGVV